MTSKRTSQQGEDPSDESLVRRAQAGEQDSFEALVNRHEKRIFALARRMVGSTHDAEDVTQQAFIQALRNLEGFRGQAAFGTWLTTIAVNTALKVLRKRRGLPVTSLDEATTEDAEGRIPHPEYVADWRQMPDRLAAGRETQRILDAAIARLDPGQRAVFLLRDVEGLSVRETARALQLTEANVKVRLMRARFQLRERLTRAFGDPASRQPPVHAHDFKEAAHG